MLIVVAISSAGQEFNVEADHFVSEDVRVISSRAKARSGNRNKFTVSDADVSTHTIPFHFMSLSIIIRPPLSAKTPLLDDSPLYCTHGTRDRRVYTQS